MNGKGYGLHIMPFSERPMGVGGGWRRVATVLGAFSVVVLLAGCLARGGMEESVSNETPGPTPALGQGGQVRGRITDPDGNPLEEVTVAVPEGTVPVPERTAITDENGDYVWSLPPGTFTLAAHKDGYVTQSASVTLGPGQTVTLDLTLPRQP